LVCSGNDEESQYFLALFLDHKLVVIMKDLLFEDVFSLSKLLHTVVLDTNPVFWVSFCRDYHWLPVFAVVD